MLYLEILNKLSTATWIFDIENKQLVFANKSAGQLWNSKSVEELLLRDFSSDMSLSTEIRLKGYLEEFKQNPDTYKIQNWTFYPNGEGPLPVIIKSSGIVVSLEECKQLGLTSITSRFYSLCKEGEEPPAERILMLVEAFYQKEFQSESDKDLLRSIEALRHTPVMISYFSAQDGSVLIQNPSSSEVFGNSLSFKDMFVYPEESDIVFQRLLSEDNGGVYRGDLLMKTLQGNQWHRIDARLSRDPITGNKGIVISHNNIHELRIYQEILEENEKRLQEAQEIANLGSWEWDLQSQSTKVSKQLFRIFGIDPHEVDIGINFPDLLQHLGCPDVLPQIDQSIASRSSFDFSHKIHRKNDSTLRILHVKGEVLLNNKGDPIRVLGISHDITDIELAKEKIEEERKFVEALIGCLKAGIVACNSKGKLTHFNKSAQALHGLELGESTDKAKLFGEMLACYKLPEEGSERGLVALEESKTPIIRALTGESFIDDEVIMVPFKDPTASKQIVLASGQEIVSKDGKSVGAVVVLHDITERKHVEEELRKATETAQHANQVKSEFLANISHEILSPMNSILGLVGMCLDNPLIKHVKDNLEDVYDSSQNLLLLLQQILDFNHLESHKLIFKPTQFKLRNTLNSILTSFYTRIIEKNVNVTCVIDPSIPDDLYGEESRLKQILLNLIDNSIKFSNPYNPTNFVSIRIKQIDRDTLQQQKSQHVTTRKRRNSNNTPVNIDLNEKDLIGLQFEIQDNGIGVPADKQQYIFDNFFQVDGSYTRTRGGIGLGLSISYMLAQRFGGDMWFESEKNKGSTFYFTICIKRAQEAATQSVHSQVSADLGTPCGLVTNGYDTINIDSNKVTPTISPVLDSTVGDACDEIELKKKRFQGNIYPTQLVNRISTLCSPVEEILKADSKPSSPSPNGVGGKYNAPLTPTHAPTSVLYALNPLETRPQAPVPSSSASSVNQHQHESLPLSCGAGGTNPVEFDLVKSPPSSYIQYQLSKENHFTYSPSVLGLSTVYKPTPIKLSSGGSTATHISPDSKLSLPSPLSLVSPSLLSGCQKILVAEDNLLNQKLIKTLLSKRGFEVSIANDGKEALNLYEENIEGRPFDCILMDIQMPVLNGLETTSAIRTREKKAGRHIPIIALTAHCIKGDKEKFLEAGLDDYVSKPINPKLLYEVIDYQFSKLLVFNKRGDRFNI